MSSILNTSTTLLKGRQEKKNLSTKLPFVGIRESIFWIDAIGIKIFHRALFEKSEFENFGILVHFVQIFSALKMTPSVFYLNFLSFNLTKNQK